MPQRKMKISKVRLFGSGGVDEMPDFPSRLFRAKTQSYIARRACTFFGDSEEDGNPTIETKKKYKDLIDGLEKVRESVDLDHFHFYSLLNRLTGLSVAAMKSPFGFDSEEDLTSGKGT